MERFLVHEAQGIKDKDRQLHHRGGVAVLRDADSLAFMAVQFRVDKAHTFPSF